MTKWLRDRGLQFGLIGFALGVFLLLVAVVFQPIKAKAAPLSQGEKPSDDTCLACHQQEGMTTQIGGHSIPLTISADKFSASVHGTEKVACVDCHTNITGYPHPAVTASTPRDFSLEMYPTCQQCHADQYQKTLDSVHQAAIAGGNKNAAVCTDCHNPHTQTRLTDEATGALLPEAKLAVPETCAQCHSTIYNTYKKSVHGVALAKGNTDVPTCTDCHGVHDIKDPTTNEFRNSSPLLCAKCHTDKTMMDKYGLNTNVLSTYFADFHGTSVKLVNEISPNQPTDKPVCTDCHGVHDIAKVDEPQTGIAMKKNLLVKCQQCHPTATTATFTDAWLSHYEPSTRAWPLLYYVNIFYRFFIPAVVGGMLVFVLSDVYRRYVNRKSQGKGASHHE